MMSFLSYLKAYFSVISPRKFLVTVLFTALLVVLNYTVGIESRMRALEPWISSAGAFFLFYGFVYFFAWGIQGGPFHGITSSADKSSFLILLLLGPAYFAMKMIHWNLSPLLPSGLSYPWPQYAQIVGQLPAKLLLLLLLLFICRKTGNSGETGEPWADRIKGQRADIPGEPEAGRVAEPDAGLSTAWGEGQRGDMGPQRGAGFWGFTTRGFRVKPYLLLLLFLVPLVALASTRPDFLRVYPKVHRIGFIAGHTNMQWWWQLLYELSYGLDFVSIELFFRGFLVIGLVRYAGERVILPMAVFYCTIHFGKPLGECISSFFGGLVLGVLAWRTRSILGGLMVHLGMAWMMEIGGWLGGLL